MSSGDIVNLMDVSILVSQAGILAFWFMRRSAPSQPWEESRGLRNGLLASLMIVLQIPLALVVYAKPDYAVGLLEVQPFSWGQLAVHYLVLGVCLLGFVLVGRRYTSS